MSSTDSTVARRVIVIGMAAVLAAVGAWVLISHSSRGTTSASTGGKPTERLIRLSFAQYVTSIQDIFGPTIAIDGRLTDAQKRSQGLLAVGNAEVSVTASGIESAEDLAQSIAGQVVNESNRVTLVPCAPASAKQADDACARRFLSSVGRLLYRRGLSNGEVQALVTLAHQAGERLGGFYPGLAAALANMLTSPDFLFRVEGGEPDPDNAGKLRLTAYSKASRLSFLLWNSGPDDVLLAAAEQGKLDSKQGLERQVQRMLASPKLKNGVRAFFSDMLEFDQFEGLSKDPTIYPRYTAGMGQELKEQALRVVVDELIDQNADYRDLFTTRETFLTPALAALTDVTLAPDIQSGEPDHWQRYEFPKGDPREGLLALPAFTALHSHSGKSSPTRRGKAIREELLCQTVPDPPSNVDFTLFNSDKAGPTARDRLQVHATVPSCAGCHKIMDPLGLALEHFDGSGRIRATENGHAINTSGELDGVRYEDSHGLAIALSNGPNLESCLVKRVYSYGVSRPVTAADRKTVDQLRKVFDAKGRHLRELLHAVATADDFYVLQLPKSAVAQSQAVEVGPTLVSQVVAGEVK